MTWVVFHSPIALCHIAFCHETGEHADAWRDASSDRLRVDRLGHVLNSTFHNVWLGTVVSLHESEEDAVSAAGDLDLAMGVLSS